MANRTVGQMADQFVADRKAEPSLTAGDVKRAFQADQAGDANGAEATTGVPTPAMDYGEHTGTYLRFQRYTEVGILGVLNIVMVLAVWTFVKSFPWMMIGLLLTLAAVGVGIAKPKLGWRPGLIVLGILGFRVMFH